MILAQSTNAKQAYKLVSSLQKRFVRKLNRLSKLYGENKKFEEITWLRDEGAHGGGNRYEARDIYHLFNTASVNVSQVHYDDMSDKRLQSASAISTIIHPKNPLVPSIHIHISLTEIRGEKAYWRIMADLNPAIVFEEDKEKFDKALKDLSEDYYEEGIQQGDKYFYIPALKRTRGVSHFYLENFTTGKKVKDREFAKKFGEGIIDTYIEIIENAIVKRQNFTVRNMQEQLSYHTLYLFQVLTLDRGTTSGLLVHDQNDVGIMGSLPKFVDRNLLASWANIVEKPQDKLVTNLAKAINEKNLIDEKTKIKLAQIVRKHYKKYPKALSLQASGNSIPTTVENHKK